MSSKEHLSPEAIEALFIALPSRESYVVGPAFRSAAKHASSTLASEWELLADIFAMGLVPRNAAEPFSPAYSDSQGRRSVIPADLSEHQLEGLSLVLPGLSIPELISRVGDVLWVTTRKRSAAERAVQAYLDAGQRQETPEAWFGAAECYERAARLSITLGRKQLLTERTLSFISQRAVSSAGDAALRTFSYSMLSLLSELRFGDARSYAAVALNAAVRSRDDQDLSSAKDFFGIAARCLDRAGDKPAADRARLEVAETLLLSAEAQERATGPAFAQHWWEETIRAFRNAPGGKERLPELHRRLTACGVEALKLMKPIGTSIDIRELVEHARKMVLGRSLPNAICALADIEEPPDPDKIRAGAEEMTKRSFISTMFSSATFDKSGRVVSRQPGLFGAGPDEHEKAIDGLMQRDVDLRRGLEVSGFIGPALQAILEEHFVEESDITDLLHGSRFIPGHRMNLFVQGLAAGFRSDFITVAHVLMPQVENAVRDLLLAAGIIPTLLTPEMVQQEWGLGRMLDQEALGEALGADFVHAFKRLLVVQGGPNLRNRLAHGMLDEGEMKTSPVLYFWWLVLKLCLHGTDAFESYVALPDGQEE